MYIHTYFLDSTFLGATDVHYQGVLTCGSQGRPALKQLTNWKDQFSLNRCCLGKPSQLGNFACVVMDDLSVRGTSGTLFAFLDHITNLNPTFVMGEISKHVIMLDGQSLTHRGSGKGTN